ncbi:hypothetical protein V8G54_009423 [Vigna mungo]|uniref:Uncharacterized protein n=1 Tax=Vigna mungo TaxID=3915 RepID=A0AAQ3S5F8_VIGMU
MKKKKMVEDEEHNLNFMGKKRETEAAVLSVDGFARIRGQERREENICGEEGNDENCDGDMGVTAIGKVAKVVIFTIAEKVAKAVVFTIAEKVAKAVVFTAVEKVAKVVVFTTAEKVAKSVVFTAAEKVAKAVVFRGENSSNWEQKKRMPLTLLELGRVRRHQFFRGDTQDQTTGTSNASKVQNTKRSTKAHLNNKENVVQGCKTWHQNFKHLSWKNLAPTLIKIIEGNKGSSLCENWAAVTQMGNVEILHESLQVDGVVAKSVVATTVDEVRVEILRTSQNWTKRIQEEWKSLEEDLPPPKATSSGFPSYGNNLMKRSHEIKLSGSNLEDKVVLQRGVMIGYRVIGYNGFRIVERGNEKGSFILRNLTSTSKYEASDDQVPKVLFMALPVARLRFSRNAPGTQQLAPTVGQGFKNSQGAMATKFDIEKFNGANDFGLWKIKMEAILIQQGCDEALKGESRMRDAMTQEEKKKMGDKARSAIILCLGDKVLREVAKEKTAAEIWAKLESLYMTRSLAHRLCLKQQLFSFKMSESRTIEEQIAEFSKIVDDLENIEVKLEDEDKAVILLNALPRTFEHFRDALLYGKDQVITLEEVLTSIRTKEFQKLQDSKTTEEGASGLISVKGKGKKQSGKEKKLNPDGTKQVRCFKCQKMGHIKKFCPEKGKAGRPQETADVAEASEGYESAGVLVASSEDPQRSWVMDSGCSYHMCPVKEFFENLDQKEHGNVLLGNNKACRVQGVGSDVRYVPELKRNLISISAFDLGGYTTKVEDGVMRVCSGDSVVAKGRRRNDLYILEGSTVIGHVSVASGTENTARLWHLRMGHISEKGLEELEKQDLLLGDKLQKLDFCDHCVLGKSHRIPFGKGKHSTERPFEYVHADLWGPTRTLTHGGGAYFLSIIDDFSRRVWIYVLKNKSETFQKFKEWHTQIENQLGCRLKCLRTDNGLEFVSEEFNGFCKEKGIRRHRTVVGTPQQNGLAERMNRTILERVRCMLLGSGLSKAFWGEAANTAVYLINRSPSSALNFKTPMEVWSGRPADYSHLRVFGSLAFAHVRGDKLDSRAAKCIFLGYAEGVKGYRLWRLDSPSKLIISRDVIFDETRMAMHPENSGSEKKILVEVEHTTNEAGTPGGTEENQTGEGQVENGRTIEENRSDEFRTDLGDDTDGMSGEGSHGKAAGVDLRNYQLVRDRERRISKPTKRLGEADLICYALNAAEDLNRSDEPRSYKEALDSSDRHVWQGAMEEELEALKKNSTWRLVDLPKGKKVIGSKWIFKKKEATPGGEKARYKARLVAKGFTQIEGVDYHEIFAPVVKHCSVRVLMAIVAHCNLHLEQLDVRTAFLHGDRVCLLQKPLYGLKQSPRQWYRKFDDFLIKLNFKRCNYDDCVYTLNHDGEMLYLLLYVDDILIASSDRGMIGEMKARLADAFEMKELGEARRILGIDIKRDRPGGNLFLSQEYRMAESKMASTPIGQHLKLTKEQCPKTEEERKKMESVPFSNGIGSIMYDMVCTRPDVAHGVSVLSQFMINPGPTHWEALKWMLRYIRGSLGTGLSFQNNFQGGGYIEGFVDSDFAGCMDTRKSRSGYVFTLFGTAVSWRSTLQSVVALSTTEAEYYALAEGVKEALWLKGLVRELGFDQKSVCVHCDSQSAIHLANHQIYHSRTKHIDVKLHFVRSIVESGDVQICKIASEENPADMLTKPLAKERFLLLLSRIGCLPVGH